MAEPNECRFSGSSYHVDYIVNDDTNVEKKNITHSSSSAEPSEDIEFGWVVEVLSEKQRAVRLKGKGPSILVQIGEERGGDGNLTICHEISLKTAEQLADMFARVAAEFRQERWIVEDPKTPQPVPGSFLDESST